MPFEFTHPWWLVPTLVALGAVGWLSATSDSSLAGVRRRVAMVLRFVIVGAVGLALAGMRYRLPVDGMNVVFVLDRSDSVPGEQQEAAREWVNRLAEAKRTDDRGGVVVFGEDAAIEATVNPVVNLPRVQAVVGGAATDLASAIRLATASFPEAGQRRMVLFTDGNETSGDALQAVLAARSLGVEVDVVPLGAERRQDVLVPKVGLPAEIKEGQAFEVRIFAESDHATPARLALYRNDQLLGSQEVELQAGKNLFAFSQVLEETGFYTYDVRLEAPGDVVLQNNRATGYTQVRGDPRLLLVSSDPAADAPLAEALRASRLEVRVVGVPEFPATLAEMQSYDAILLGNVAAGELEQDLMRLLEGAVRDFGVGVVAIGGDQAFAAGGYRGTPLEEVLPVEMELSSRKVLPRGALVLVVHATEFPNGNQWARDIAFAALQALGPQDEMGVVLWDGNDRWLFPLSPVGDKREKGRAITGMTPGDMPAFENVMGMAHAALAESTANLRHMVVFSDGDPTAPSAALLDRIVGDRISLSTVMIGGHVEPGTMIEMAEKGRGRFYDVRSPALLPQIFVKEAAVILKSAIDEEPFRPRAVAGSEVIRGIEGGAWPELRGYVATTAKGRAEVPLVTGKGDPLLAHWQLGLGRSVAFTSDARARWAAAWLGWGQYRQFWSQVAQWVLRRTELADFNAEFTVEDGEGRVQVEALDEAGEYRNFLNLQAMVVSPSGRRQAVRLEQKGPGRYEASFPAREVGAWLLNLHEVANEQVRRTQTLGANVNFSAEFRSSRPNLPLLTLLAEGGGGRVLRPENPADNPFVRDRRRTDQPVELWWWLLALAVVLFPIDVGVRRVELDPAEVRRVLDRMRGWLLPGRRAPIEAPREALGTLLARKEQVRSALAGTGVQPGTGASGTPAGAAAPVLRDASAGPQEGGPAPAPSPGAASPPTPETRESATQRLLEAKRRVQRRR